MNGTELAQYVLQKYGGCSPEELAQRAGIQVFYDRWVPVTYGEYDRKKRVITLNQNAPLPLNIVLAHELGHFFADQQELGDSRQAHECIAEEFTHALLRWT